jgi:hypothetical protein
MLRVACVSVQAGADMTVLRTAAVRACGAECANWLSMAPASPAPDTVKPLFLKNSRILSTARSTRFLAASSVVPKARLSIFGRRRRHSRRHMALRHCRMACAQESRPRQECPRNGQPLSKCVVRRDHPIVPSIPGVCECRAVPARSGTFRDRRNVPALCVEFNGRASTEKSCICTIFRRGVKC